MLVRIRGPSGLHRVQLLPENDFGQLKKLFGGLVGLGAEGIVLFRDNGGGKPVADELLAPDTTKLSALGLEHGTMLHYRNKDVEMVDAEEESRRACSLNAAKYNQEQEKKRAEEEKIRGQMFQGRSGWGSNAVTFRKVVKLTMLKFQKERVCVQAQITSASVKILSKAVIASGFTTHRCALIFGTLKRRKQRVSLMRWHEVAMQDEMVQTVKMRMETIWEPPQIGDAEGVVLLEEGDNADKVQRAEEVAACLGLECVGVMLTVPMQETKRLRPRDILLAAKLQAKYGPGFTTIAVFVGQDNSGAPVSTAEAFQCTESCVQLFRQDDLEPEQPDDHTVELKEVMTVYRQMPDGTMKETDSMRVEVEMFQMTVPVVMHATRLLSPPVFFGARDELGAYLSQFAAKPWARRVADFNLLMYLQTVLDKENGFKPLCRAIVEGAGDPQGSLPDNLCALVQSHAG